MVFGKSASWLNLTAFSNGARLLSRGIRSQSRPLSWMMEVVETVCHPVRPDLSCHENPLTMGFVVCVVALAEGLCSSSSPDNSDRSESHSQDCDVKLADAGTRSKPV